MAAGPLNTAPARRLTGWRPLTAHDSAEQSLYVSPLRRSGATFDRYYDRHRCFKGILPLSPLSWITTKRLDAAVSLVSRRAWEVLHGYICGRW